MEWISVKDRLPEKNTWVLCFLPKIWNEISKILSLEFFIYEWTENGTKKVLPMFKTIDRSWRIEDVTHWMPLPEPPNRD